jgi:hypothetical protein
LSEQQDEPPVATSLANGEEYAVLEVLGRRQHIGHIRKVVRYGIPMLHVFDMEMQTDHWYAMAAIFSITATTKEEIEAVFEQKRRAAHDDEDGLGLDDGRG